jgi:hypothetical protein
MKVSTENDNNFGYEKITIVVDNIPLTRASKVIVIRILKYSCFVVITGKDLSRDW